MKRKANRFIAIFMMTLMIATQLSMIAEAIPVGDADITLIEYIVERDSNYNIENAAVVITGSNLAGLEVRFSVMGSFPPYKEMGEMVPGNSIVQFRLTPQEVESFTGQLMIEGQVFDLGLSSFPTIDSATRIVNISEGDSLSIKGRNLDEFKKEAGVTIKGEYGKGGNFKEFGDGNTDSETITIENATPSGDRGLQNIRISKEKQETSETPKIQIRYNYNNVFSFVSDLNISDMEMYPNTGARGDLLYIRSEDFTEPYDVYFFSVANASTEVFSANNKAIYRGFTQKSELNPKAMLTVEVPQGIDLGSHYVILAETINNQVVAQQMIMRDNEPDIYTVVDATNRPRIQEVNPNYGADVGGEPIEILGSNILRSSISPSELVIDYSANEREFELSQNKQEVTVTYNAATYQGETVTVERTVKIQIGGVATFQEIEVEGETKPRVEVGSTDRLYAITPRIDDADTNPYKEVLAEIKTVVTSNNDPNKEYIFQEIAVWSNKFRFDPSSIRPIIDTVTPDKVQLEGNNLKEDTLIAIKGQNFMVNRYINNQGETIVNYPKILFKTANDTDTYNYELMIEKEIIAGEITAKASWRNPPGEFEENVEITVLDSFNRVIDGTAGREVGTRILVKIPQEVVVSTGMKNVQVTNPTKGSQEIGLSDIQLDKIEFVIVPDNPYIEEVDPDMVTIDGGQDIEVKGSNFQEGVKVFIDGEEVPGVTREIAAGGNQFVLRFKAPPGREGVTQLLVMNPSGGMDVADFTYVDTIGKDPKIISFSPNKGSNGTLVVVNGENFLKPDPTTKDVSGNGIYRLIGTRILLDGQDINSYHKVGNTIALQNYAARDGEANQLIQRDGAYSVKLADYYHSVLLHDETNNQYYTLDLDNGGNIVLSDGVQNNYRILQPVADENAIFTATKGGVNYSIEIVKQAEGPDSLIISGGTEDINLVVKTPYAVQDNIIIGNRVQVLTKNQILFTVPQLGVEKWYNLSVQNPDTKIDTRTGQNGFYYFRQPQRNPEIISIFPPQGSSEGGYSVDIEGKDFQDYGGTQKTKVIVGGVEVPASDVTVSTDGTKISFIIPPYPGDLRSEVTNGRKTVPVVVVNIDGGSASKIDGFTYVVPTSNPTINQIIPNTGNAAGGETVIIRGTDFRFYEPYEDSNGNARYDEGEPFQDLNGDGEWTDISGREVGDLTEEDKKILPMVYFGKHRAEILDFSDGRLVVSTPTATQGVVDVFVVNNDFGTSNKVRFTYEASSPRIDNIVPPTGTRFGGDKIHIDGREFSSSNLHVYNENVENGVQQYDIREMPLVHFGDTQNPNISNRSIELIAPNGGLIVNGRASVEVGNITVDYQSTASNTKIVLQMTEGGETYSFQIDGYDNTVKYVTTTTLKNADGEPSSNTRELIRLEIDTVERKLIVERGYTPFHPNASMTSRQIVLYTPSHYTIGRIPLTVINPDGSRAQGQYEYKHPDSNPRITNITKEGLPPVEDNINGEEVRLQRMTYKGGNIVRVIGEDFRNAEIFISNVAHIRSGDFIEASSTQITFEMPDVGEDAVGRLHAVTVQNQDGGVASSDELTPPIYIEFIKGESNPVLNEITPDRGPATGGTRVKITGSDFRESMQGFEGEVLKVFFGETAILHDGEHDLVIEDADSPNPPKIIYVDAPASINNRLGEVTVRVENPDGALAVPPLSFTYISQPKVISVDPTKLFSNDTETEVTIKGEMFLQGAQVVLGGKIIDEDDIEADMEVQGTGILGVDDEGNNNNIAVIGGVLATSVTVDDEEAPGKTLKVKFPEAFDLENSNIIIINPDGGISDEYKDFIHEIPIPTKPLVLEGIPGYESTVQLIWSDSEPELLNAAEKYEIYGKLSTDRNYSFIGDTEGAEFLVRGLEPNTRYDFMVRALNRYGSALEFAEVSVRTLSLREDDKLQEKQEELDKAEEKLRKEGKEEVIDGALVKTIGTDQITSGGAPYIIDFSLSQYSSYDKFVVALPVALLADLNRNIMITDGDANFTFNARSLYTREVIQGGSQNREDAHVEITFEKVTGQTAEGLYSAIPRNQRRASAVYSIDFNLQVGRNTTAIRQMLQNGNMLLDFDSRAYPNANSNSLFIGSYDPSRHQFIRQRDGNNTSFQAPASFVLLTNR